MAVHRVGGDGGEGAGVAVGKGEVLFLAKADAHAAADVDKTAPVGGDVAEHRREAENVLAPVDAVAAALAADLGELVGVAEHVAGAVELADAAQHVPVVKLAVCQVTHQAFRRGGHLVGLVVEAVGVGPALDEQAL